MDPSELDKRVLRLLSAADALAAHNHEQWREFVMAFAAYSEVPMMQLLNATNEGNLIHHMQGRARLMHELAELLMDHKNKLFQMSSKIAAQNRLKPAQKKV